MKFQLIDFQRRASEQLVTEIKKAQARYDADNGDLGAVVLEAATGAGKTVIATSVLEQLFFGSDFTEPIDQTTVLWVTSDPSLNAQTARKMQEASEKISDVRLIGQGASFDEKLFEPGVIYFLNTQAASVSARITKKSDTQTWTIWDTISNTVDQYGSRFLVIVDEAHHGVTEKVGASPTVINKILSGRRPVPVFIGISATAERLHKAIAQQNRLSRNVSVPIESVRESGLVKDRITLAPAADTSKVVADTTFVRLAVQKTLEFEARWAHYSLEHHEPRVLPALVVQLPDQKSDDQDFKSLIRAVVNAVMEEWPGLIAGNIVHTFGEHSPIDLGAGRAVRYMPPQDIQDAPDARVVLAKNAITTGWDCPRAEVLVSLRASAEHTPIAQLIGRIVRQPLARRIASDEALNKVHAFLPRFDRQTVMSVVQEFSGTEAGATAELVRLTLGYESPQTMREPLEVLSGLPSYVVPSQSSVPEVRRLHSLAALLDNDGVKPSAVAHANAFLNARLDAEADKLDASGELEPRRAAVSNASVHEMTMSIDGLFIDGAQTLVGTRLDAKNIDDVFRRATRKLKDGTAETYWGYLVERFPDDDPIEGKITVAALALDERVVRNIEQAAGSLIRDWFEEHGKAISVLPEADRARYARLLAESREPARRPAIVTAGFIEDAVSISAAPEATDDELRARIANDSQHNWPQHLYQNADGMYWKKPTPTDGLEREVLAAELGADDLVGWYRNPTGGDRALCIPYRTSSTGIWSRLFPDFVFFHRTRSGVAASIVDPHGLQLKDWTDKLRGYVDYADEHSSAFRAIFPLTVVDNVKLVLPMHDASVRGRVRTALESGEAIETIFASLGLRY